MKDFTLCTLILLGAAACGTLILFGAAACGGGLDRLLATAITGLG